MGFIYEDDLGDMYFLSNIHFRMINENCSFRLCSASTDVSDLDSVPFGQEDCCGSRKISSVPFRLIVIQNACCCSAEKCANFLKSVSNIPGLSLVCIQYTQTVACLYPVYPACRLSVSSKADLS